MPIACLMAFEARGGKILSYFGWADAAIATTRGLAWYHAVAGRSPLSVQTFYRLFMVPGMTHCQGGKSPTSFGQSLDAPARDGRADAPIGRQHADRVEGAGPLAPPSPTAIRSTRRRRMSMRMQPSSAAWRGNM